MSEAQWVEFKRNLASWADFLSDGLFLLVAGVVILFIMLGWSHILLLAWFSAHRILYTGSWILISIVVLSWIAEHA